MWDIDRTQWGAGAHRASRISLPVLGLILHHSVTAAWRGAAAARNLRQIALSRGFVDISYSALADVAGAAIEGRGWGRAGAHTSGYNSRYHAVCAVGNFDVAPMPQAMVNGIARICRRHRPYGPARITHGHRDLGSTACPGRYGYARIGAINTAAAGTTTLPPASPPPTYGDDDMTPEQAKQLKYVHDMLKFSIAPGQTSPAGTVVSNHKHGVETVRKIRDVPTGDQVWWRVVAAARFVRDETPGQEVDLDGIAQFVADATAAAVREELPAVLADLTPEAIADAVTDALPDDLAAQVIDELSGRLAAGG